MRRPFQGTTEIIKFGDNRPSQVLVYLGAAMAQETEQLAINWSVFGLFALNKRR